MSTVALESFLADVLPRVSGCPEDAANRELLHAARDLCWFSGIWRQTLDPMSGIKNQSTYTLTAPEDAEIVRLLNMRYDTVLLDTVYTEEGLDQFGWNWRDITGSPHTVIHEDADTFRLVPTPDKSMALGITDIRVALQPALDATTLPSFLSRDYAQAIADGALARLFALPGKQWSDGNMSTFHGKEFAVVKSRAKARAQRGFKSGPIRAQPQRFV